MYSNLSMMHIYLYLPTPCGDVVVFEVQFLDDYEKIYNTGEVRVKDQGKHLSFEIPEGTKKLNLEGFTLDDPARDHYILADPQLMPTSNTFAAPSLNMRNVVTT